MKFFNSTLLFLFILVTISCNENHSASASSEPNFVGTNSTTDYKDEAEQSVASELSHSATANTNGSSGKIPINTVTNRKMIWRADVEFQVEDMEKSSNKISTICEQEGAFISGMNMTTTNYRISNRMQIRVNSEKFNALIDQLKGESVFMDRIEITSNDVTEEFIDIESRLKTKKDVRERYINILRNKTGSIKDVIEAEEAIRTITEEIEAKEGRLRYLRDQVSLSTITLTIYQKVEFKRAPNVYEKSYGDDVVDSFGLGWRIITTLVLGLVAIWPILLIGIIVLVIWKRKKRKQQK